MILGFLRRRKREKIRQRAVPSEWRTFLRKRMPYWSYLPPEDQERLLKHVQIFIAEKSFVGCGGLDVTNEMRVVTAGWACLLLLKRETSDYFPDCDQILLYPDTFEVPMFDVGEAGEVHEEFVAHEGQSWERGSVILSWASICDAQEDLHEGFNVVLHEFAHQLDAASGATDGAPPLESRDLRKRWVEIFTREYRALREAEEQNREDTVLDPYGAESPAEFFAVATETFFDNPHPLKRDHSDLYECLKAFYAQDPAAIVPPE